MLLKMEFQYLFNNLPQKGKVRQITMGHWVVQVVAHMEHSAGSEPERDVSICAH